MKIERRRGPSTTPDAVPSPPAEFLDYSIPRPEPLTITVDRRVQRLAAYSWRILVMAAALVALLWLVGQLLLVVTSCSICL